MASYKYKEDANLGTVTLGSSYTSGSGSMSLSSGHGARLPASGDFWLTYDDGAGTVQIFKVTARSTDTLTVVASTTEGSGDGSISSGATLRPTLTCAAMDQFRADMCGYGTYANLPATCKIGDRYVTSDSIYEFVATATNTWTAFHKGKRVVVPPSSGWSWNGNQGSATVDWTYGYGLIYVPASATDSLRGVTRAVTPPFTVTAKFAHVAAESDFSNSGLVLMDTQTGKSLTYGRGITTGSVAIFGSFYFATTTSAGSSRFAPRSLLTEYWVRVVDDNSSTRKAYWSVDGQAWLEMNSTGRTTDLTAAYAGFYGNSVNSTAMQVMLISWEVT